MIQLNSTKSILSKDAFIQEGCAPNDDVLILACTIGEDTDDPKNEVYLVTTKHQLHFGFAGEALVSVDWHTDGTAFVMGNEGSVIRFHWSEISSEKDLKDSRELFENTHAVEIGPMRRIRIIDGTPVCVGSFGQIYSFQHGRFKKFPFLDIYDDEVTIKDIAGESLTDMIAVTQQGHVAIYNGSHWVNIDLPAQGKLSGITRSNDGHYVVVGSEGNFFIGEKDHWVHHHANDKNRDYYGVAIHDTLIYLAHIGGVDMFDGKNIEEISYDKKTGLEFAYLSSGKTCVWSCNGSTIGHISNRKWITLMRK